MKITTRISSTPHPAAGHHPECEREHVPNQIQFISASPDGGFGRTKAMDCMMYEMEDAAYDSVVEAYVPSRRSADGWQGARPTHGRRCLMRHLKYLGTGVLAAVIIAAILGSAMAVIAGVWWLTGNYPHVATAFAVLGFLYFLGFGIIEQHEQDAIAAERAAYHKEQADKLRAMGEELTGRNKDGMV
jgi:hypothetical protein